MRIRTLPAVINAVFFVAAGAAALPCTHSFDAPRTIVTTAAPFGVADFDGDGRADLATLDSIVLSFSSRVPLPSAFDESLNALPRITDVNRDGRPDLVTVRPDDIRVLVNSGDATFTEKRTPRIGQTLGAVAFADFNGDGLLDVFAPGSTIYLASGDGTFTPENALPSANYLYWVAADMDGDHLPDLVASNGGHLLVFRRDGHGFTPVTGRSVTVKSVPLLAADFDRDGRDDLVLWVDNTNNSLGEDVTIMYGTDGTAPPRTATISGTDGTSLPDFPGTRNPFNAADVNGDDAPDLVVNSVSALRVLLNDGRGNLETRWELPAFSVSAVADADGDGIADLIVTSRGEPAVLHGNGDGTFRVPSVVLKPATFVLSPIAGRAVVAGDLDGDGDDDVVLRDAVGWNNGDNTFRLMPVSDGRLGVLFATADIDGDGAAEVISSTQLTSGLPAAMMVLRMRPDGSISEVALIETARDIVEVAVGDFSGQRRLEIAALTHGAPKLLQVFEIRYNAPPRHTAAVSDLTLNIAAGDLNGDGADDIVLAGGSVTCSSHHGPCPDSSSKGFVSTFLSTGTSFEAERVTPVLVTPARDVALAHPVVGDFDGDGKADVAAGTVPPGHTYPPLPGRLFAFHSDGRGTFDRGQELLLGDGTPGLIENEHVVTAADFNGDGRIDVSVNGAAQVFYGTPAGLAAGAGYFGPFALLPQRSTYFPVTVKPRREALPSILVVTLSRPEAFIYRPLCGRLRSVRR